MLEPIFVYIYNISELYKEALSFSYNLDPDVDKFRAANYTLMGEMAEFYDDRFEKYHIPLNFSVNTFFADDNCSIVSQYGYTDNGAQWTGLAMTSWVFKYLTAKKEHNTEMENQSIRVIRKLLTGMSMLLAVPNGGLGPNYSGILARGYADPAHRDIAHFFFNDPPCPNDTRHHNGTGPYSNWRWRGFTSNDEYSGFYSALALVLKFVDIKDIHDLAVLMADQIANYMINTNFLGIDWDGSPTGVNQKAYFLHGGTWVMLLLKAAALAVPEKYEKIYYHYAINEYYALSTSEGGEQETICNYYSLAFGYHIMFALLLLENDTQIHQLILKNFENSLRKYTRFHRNPFYNIIELALNYKPGENVQLERDVEDQLMRYRDKHFPDRAYGRKNYTQAQNYGDDPYSPIENVDKLMDFLRNDPYGYLYMPAFTEVDNSGVFLNRPMTNDYLDGNIFIWEKNPFFSPSYTYINPRFEFAGFSFPLIYWMGRYFGFFKANGTREI
ncbi:MAG: hypothetical protein ACTSU2_16705 [Promethearchaeota archaeon]